MPILVGRPSLPCAEMATLDGRGLDPGTILGQSLSTQSSSCGSQCAMRAMHVHQGYGLLLCMHLGRRYD
jgi:hypothetical protein